MLDPVRQGTPCFARFRMERRFQVPTIKFGFSLRFQGLEQQTWGMGRGTQKREGGWGAAGPGKSLHVCWAWSMSMRSG